MNILIAKILCMHLLHHTCVSYLIIINYVNTNVINAHLLFIVLIISCRPVRNGGNQEQLVQRDQRHVAWSVHVLEGQGSSPPGEVQVSGHSGL